MDLLMSISVLARNQAAFYTCMPSFGANLAHGMGRLAKIKFNEHTSVGVPVNRLNLIVNNGEVRPSERRRGLKPAQNQH